MDASLTQKYLLCTLNNQGKYPVMDVEKGLCLVVGGILELLMNRITSLHEKKLFICKPLSAEMEYLLPVYQYIHRKEPVKLQSVVEYFSFNFSNKNLNHLMERVGDSLVAAGWARKEAGGLFRKTALYLPDAQAKDNVVQSLRAELLEDGSLTEDIIALTALLSKSGTLSQFFSTYEKKELKARLRSIKSSPENQLVTQMMDYIESLFALIVIAAT